MRVAIIGLNWAVRTHLPILRQLGWTIAGLVGRDRQRALEVANSHGVSMGADSLSELALREALDFVAIAVPWAAHAQRLREAISFDAAVLIEHPVSAFYGDSRRLLDEIADRHQPIFANFPTRYLPPARQLISAIERNNAQVDVDHLFEIPEDEEREWFNILASHSLDFARFTLGELELAKVTADGAEWVDIGAWPSWSWPAIIHADQCRAMRARTWSLEFHHSRGKYRLIIGQRPIDVFRERVAARLADRCLAYETCLSRQDESSPWMISDVVEGTNGDLPPVTYKGGTEDAWYIAQVEQMRAITAILSGGTADLEPATITDAVAVQKLISDAMSWLADSHAAKACQETPASIAASAS